MPRIQFSDVVPPNKRSIRDVPIPSGGKRKVPIVIKPERDEATFKTAENKNNEAQEYYYPKNINEPKQYDDSDRLITHSGSRRKKWIFGVIAFLLIGVFIAGMMTVFSSASINIVPKNQEIDVDMKITGTNEKQDATVRYEVIKLSESKTVSVPATGEEVAELKASGKIVIYNNFSAEPQRLIVRTRFESPGGLIFRIPESVIVPGKTIKAGVETPGSIEVEIFADEAGEKYNIKKSDFTIPGFKNDANRYKNFYARSATEMSGGFVGKVKKAAEADKQTALQEIDLEVKDNLQKSLGSKIPEGLVLLSDSIIYKSKELSPKEDGSSIIVGKEVTAYAIMLNTQDLSNKITNEYILKLAEWNDIKPMIKNFSLLKITNKPDDLGAGNKIDLQINGKVRVLANIDTNTINQRLLGAPKKEVAKLMDEFAGILSITATIRPIWKQSFPNNPLKIHVQTSAD